MSSKEDKLRAFARILDVIDTLREKCPWDKKQTIESLRHLTIEEVFELSDAILDNDMANVKKELGDVLMHLVFYAKIGEEQGEFDMAGVIDTECEKLIYRHPHVYGQVEADTVEKVKQNWEKLKLKEKDGNRSVFAGVPRSLPAMIKAYRIQEKARGVGFDWENKEQVWAKVREEIGEFQQEEQREDTKAMEDEFGDVLFSLVNYARFVGINPETALERTNRKFIARFTLMEEFIKGDGKSLGEMELEELDLYWEKAKAFQK